MVYQQQSSSQQSQRSVVSHQQTGLHHNNSSQQQQLGQYMGQQHQQMQSNTHHGSSSAAAAAYYQQQAHMYQPAYQQSPGHNQQEQARSQQQQTSQQHQNADYQTHHHLSGSNIPVTGQVPSGSVAGVHSNVHHHQQNSQNSALNHATWSPGVGSINPQTHHPVVTDHSAMAYLAHPYQSHTSTVSDHHRNSTGPMGSQAGHQASSYPVDALYNSSSAAAAVAAAAAAYGYNNYNAAFFQTSNSGPHSQTGPMSTFWNHNQPTQQQQQPQQQQQQQQQRQGPISQQQQQPTNTNQNSQQRQPTIGSEQAGTNFMHDPRMYYGSRPPTYGQGLPNIGQSTQAHETQSAELMHHRMTGLPQLHQMFPTHHADLHQSAPVTHQAAPGAMPTAVAGPHQTPIGQHPQLTSSLSSSTSIHQQHHLTNTHNNQQQQQPISSLSSTTVTDNTAGVGQTPTNEQQPVGNRQIQPIKSVLQPPIQKQPIISSENDKLLQRDSSATSKQAAVGSDYGNQLSDATINPMGEGPDNVFQSGKDPLKSKDQQQPSANKNYASSTSSSAQNVIKSEPYQNPYQKQQQALSKDNSSAAPGSRPIYKTQQHQDDRPKLLQQNDNSKTASNTNTSAGKSQTSATDSNSGNYRLNQAAQAKSSRSPPPTIIPDQPSPDQLSSLEDSMSSLTVSSPRKTTWASIASQPAKVTQPKSLKSKIAGSTSALSNAKHLAVVSLDSSSGESKNGGINPAIKSSVSAATTSLQRSSMPPPITKLPTVAASLKLDLLGDSIGPNSKISWPAVNASANLQSELLREKEAAAAAAIKQQTNSNSMMGDNKYRSSNNYHDDRNRLSSHRSGDSYDRDRGDAGDDLSYKDHNHNHGSVNMYNNSKMGNRDPYGDRDDGHPSHHQREPWARRGGGVVSQHDRDHRDYHHENNRYRRDSDRDNVPNEHKEDLREVLNSRRDNNNISYRQNINGPNRVMGNNGPNHRADRELSADEPGFRDRGGFVNKQRPPLLDNRNKPLLRGNTNNSNNPDPRDNGPPPPRFSSQYNNNGNGGRFGEPRGHNSRAPYQQNSFRDSRDRGMDMPNNNREHDREDSRDDRDSSNQSVADLPTLNPSNYNPKTFDLEPPNARYFIIKSYSGDDIYRSIKYSIWCSTNHGNKKLDEAFRSQQAKIGSIYLFFSVNGSGHFCGMAQMTSAVDFDSSTGVWAQSKWQGEFSVKWIHVKDVPNNALRHITLENNEDKPVTNSRDTQEVPSEKGKSVLKIIHTYVHSASIFDQFQHYERRQEEDRLKRSSHPPPPLNMDHQDRPQLLDGDRGHHDGSRHYPHHNQHHHSHNNRRFDDDRRGNGNDGGPPATRFGGRPYINPRPHNDFPGNNRGGRMGGPRGPPRGDGPAAPSDKQAGFPRENGDGPGIRGAGIKLTQ